MAEYRLALDPNYIGQLQVLGKAVSDWYKKLSEARQPLSIDLSTIPQTGAAAPPRIWEGMRSWAQSEHAARIMEDDGERRRWQAWEFEVLIASGMPEPWCRKVADDAGAVLRMLGQGLGSGALPGFVERISRPQVDSFTLMGTHTLFLFELRQLVPLLEKDLAVVAPDGNLSLSGVAVQVFNKAGLMFPDIADEATASLVASIILMSPTCLSALRATFRARKPLERDPDRWMPVADCCADVLRLAIG